MSPSPSMSAANTLLRRIGRHADRVLCEVLAAVVLVPRNLVVIVNDALSTSRSPSPSTSAANTLAAQSAAVLIVCVREVLAAVVLVPGDLVVIVRRAEHVQVAVSVHVRRKHAQRPIKGRSVLIVCSAKFCYRPFSYQAILSVIATPDALSTSMSPSPSTSARKHAPRSVGRRADRVRREVLAAVVLVPRNLVVDLDDALSTSMSPSPSTIRRKHAVPPHRPPW